MKVLAVACGLESGEWVGEGEGVQALVGGCEGGWGGGGEGVRAVCLAVTLQTAVSRLPCCAGSAIC